MPSLRCTGCGRTVKVHGLAGTCLHCGKIVSALPTHDQQTGPAALGGGDPFLPMASEDGDLKRTLVIVVVIGGCAADHRCRCGVDAEDGSGGGACSSAARAVAAPPADGHTQQSWEPARHGAGGAHRGIGGHPPLASGRRERQHRALSARVGTEDHQTDQAARQGGGSDGCSDRPGHSAWGGFPGGGLRQDAPERGGTDTMRTRSPG